MAKRRRRVDQSRVGKWSGLIDAWSRSGLSQREFCLKEGVPLSTFQYWRYQRGVGEVERRGKASRKSGRAITESPADDSGPAFVPVQVAVPASERTASAGSLVVVLSNERRIEVGPGFDAEALTRLVTLLESVPC